MPQPKNIQPKVKAFPHLVKDADTLVSTTETGIIVLIEDNRTDAMVIEKILGSLNRREIVLVLPTLERALALLMRSQPTLIITDLGLPDCEGLEVVRRLCAIQPYVPLIVLTGNDGDNLGNQAISLGAQDFLTKGTITPKSLERVVRFAEERMRHRIFQNLAELKLRNDLLHKERILTLTRTLGAARNLNQLAETFSKLFPDLFYAKQFTLFVLDSLQAQWRLLTHNHPRWEGKETLSFSEKLPGLMGECVAGRKMIAYEEMSNTSFGSANAHRYQNDNAICIPLLVEGHVIGILNLNDNPSETFETNELQNLSNLAEHLAITIYNGMSYEEYLDMAHRDGLTRLYNRWYLQHQLPQELVRIRRYSSPFTLVMADLDYFKAVNDKYGHPAGDLVLLEFSRLLMRSIRDSDMAFRVGGEEFLLLLTNTKADQATLLVERIRLELQGKLFVLDSGESIKITASFGVTEALPKDTHSEITSRADKALYEAKQSGRNRFVLG
jgi:diguanylate cyclase (GGDEF)-like protein